MPKMSRTTAKKLLKEFRSQKESVGEDFHSRPSFDVEGKAKRDVTKTLRIILKETPLSADTITD